MQGAVAYVRNRGAGKIGLLGFSYGGIASMVSAPLCAEVSAVVSDGGPVRMQTAIAGRGVEWHFPRWFSTFFGWVIVSITSLRLGRNLFACNALRWVGRISPRPILFIHGEDDPYCTDFDDLWDAAREPKEAWRLPGVGHTKASELYPARVRTTRDRVLREVPALIHAFPRTLSNSSSIAMKFSYFVPTAMECVLPKM